jgi:hypothetical protein
MKTKIVYVLVSDNSDIYLEQTLLSVYSAKYHMPSVDIILIVDDLTNKELIKERATILKYISNKIVVNIEDSYSNQQKSRILKTSMIEYLSEDFLFIDSDTIILAPLDDIDNLRCTIGAVKNIHASSIKYNPTSDFIRKFIKKTGWNITDDIEYFNSGVIFVKNNELARKFFKDWNFFWNEGRKKGVYIDQIAFTKANIENNNIIQELSGIWNCQIRNGIKYFSNIKILHFFSTRFPPKTPPLCIFMDKKFYQQIKKSKITVDDFEIFIKNPFHYFVDTTYILHNQEVFMWNTETVMLLRYIYDNYNSFFSLIDKFSYFVRMLHKSTKNKK